MDMTPNEFNVLTFIVGMKKNLRHTIDMTRDEIAGRYRLRLNIVIQKPLLFKNLMKVQKTLPRLVFRFQ